MPKHMTEEYVPINGIFQYFLHIQNPSKDVMIMLHGGPGLANSYLAYYQEPYLDFCNVVYYDQRGAGKTQLKNEIRPEGLSVDVLLEDLRQTIAYIKQKYETDRVFLVGHSWGTMLGTQYILQYPQDVTGYIGYGQVVSQAAEDTVWYEYLKAAVLKSGNQENRKILAGVSENFPHVDREAYFKEYAVLFGLSLQYDYMVNDVFEIYSKSPIWTAEDEILSNEIEAFNKKLYDEVLFGYDVSNVKEYQLPIYYVLGRYDEMTSSKIAAAYFETITAPKKGLYWIEDAGHLVDTDNPSAFFKVIKEILAQ